jgi:hypothetical protein
MKPAKASASFSSDGNQILAENNIASDSGLDCNPKRGSAAEHFPGGVPHGAFDPMNGGLIFDEFDRREMAAQELLQRLSGERALMR